MSQRGYEGTHVQPAVKTGPLKRKSSTPETPAADAAAEKRQRSTRERLEARAAEKRQRAEQERTGAAAAQQERQPSARERRLAEAEARRQERFTQAFPADPPAWIRRPLSRERRKRRIFLIAAVAAALALAVLAFVLTDRSGASARQAYMAQAAASYQAGEYDAALSTLRKAARIRTDDACLALMADCYEAQGNLDKTLELLRQMETKDESVSRRIAELEQRRRLAAEADLLTVAGRQLAPDTRDLVLDDMGLTDAVLPQIAQLHALDSLSLMNNDLEDLRPLSVLGGLDTLNLSGNRVSDLRPLSGLTQLRTLFLDGNPLTDLTPLYGLQALNTLSICGVELTQLQLAELAAALPDCAIRSDTPRATTTDLTLGGVTFKSDVTELNLSGLGIHDIRALAACGSLRWLNLSGNAVSDLTPLMNLPDLEILDVSDNQVTDLRPLMGLGKLRTLDVSGNRIADTAAVGAMKGLTALDLSNNAVGDFSGLRKLKSLHTLRLENTGISDGQLVYLEELALLELLRLDDNSGLSNEAMGRLQSALPNCTISYTELIYTVNVGGYEQPSNATVLDLSAMDVVDVTGLDQMSCLETVDLSQNDIRNIYILQYSPSRDTIRSLDLSYNQLADITALSALSAVETLDLRYNNISSVLPLMGLTTLRSLALDGNPLSEQQLQALQDALPDCSITTE